jgi:hypothetical protein|tara:strand:+ start:615 stop:788 length:174 start_codon:yes stop_codon:yes gene_type:complete
MFGVVIKDKELWRLFTAEIFLTLKDAEDYGIRNKFKKHQEWKAVPFKHEYFYGVKEL